jgi:hypothetical protein
LKALQLQSMKVRDGKAIVPVSAKTMKSVLKHMADYCWSSGIYWASAGRLAKEINCHSRTVRRAYIGLESIQILILLGQRVGCAKRYSINWGEIASLTTHKDVGHSDANLGHSDRNLGHSDKKRGHNVLRTLINPKEPPPIQPASGWEAVEAALIGLPEDRRPTAWHDGLRAARARGVSIQYVLELIEHYNAHGTAYSAGALYRRLQRSHPDVPPTEGWPKPSPSATVATSTLDVTEAIRRIETPIIRAGRLKNVPESAIRDRVIQRLTEAGIDPELSEFVHVMRN